MFAEFIGTFILTVIGIGTTFSGNGLGPLAGGIGVMLGIYYAANVSGGHVNPAVTGHGGSAFFSLRICNTQLNLIKSYKIISLM